MKNKINIFILTIISTFIFIMPSFAVSPENKASTWAVDEIIDANFSGIADNDFLKSIKNFKEPVRPEDLKHLEENTRKKLDFFNLEKNSLHKKTHHNYSSSRDNVLNNVYDIMGEYIPDINNNRNNFLTNANILRGNGSGMYFNDTASYEQAILFFNRAVKYYYDINDIGGKGFLYSISKENNKVYLYGSIHIGQNYIYPFNKTITDCFNSSDELFVEVNIMKNDNNSYIDSKRYYSDGKSLKDAMDKNKYEKLVSILKKYNISEDKFKNLKPWAAYNFMTNLSTSVYMNNAYSLGVDRYFLTKAYFLNKPVKELENIKLQTDILSAFSDEEYISLINNYVDYISLFGLKSLSSSSYNLINAWYSGKESNLNKLIDKNDKYSRNLFDNRDIAMADTIEQLLNSNNNKIYFIVAGSAHFTPDDSIIAILKQRGYKINKIDL